MKVTELTVGRRASYHENPNQLFGEVTIEGDEGKQTISLSYKAIHSIFRVLSNEVIEQAELNAKAAKRALQDAMNEPLVLEHNGEIKIEHSNSDIHF